MSVKGEKKDVKAQMVNEKKDVGLIDRINTANEMKCADEENVDAMRCNGKMK